MRIGLAYAMGGEIESLLEMTGAKLLETAAGVPIYEAGPEIFAYAGGVGKVNAAMSAQLFIDRYRPDWIVSVGVAGCFADVPVGTIVLADRFVQHDVDTSAVGDPVGFVSTVERVEFPTDELERVEAILARLGVPHLTGKAATGEIFMKKGPRAQWIVETFHPLLCEMEGGAAAQVCLRNAVKFTALKAVSDRPLLGDGAAEYFSYGPIMERLNRAALPLAEALRDGD